MVNGLLKKLGIILGITSVSTGVVSADSNLYIRATTTNVNNNAIFCKHKTGASEAWDGINDAKYLNPPGDQKIHFYSWNPLTMPTTDGRVKTDARPVDSMSTFTLPFAGENLIDPNVPATLYFENRLAPEINNALAFFYDNVKDPADPTFSTDPNWVYSGLTLDAQEAGKTPAVSYVTVPVQNGLSNIMQVKYFPPEDVNFDGNVNMHDFAQLAQYWQTTFKEGVYPRTAYSPTDHPEVYVDINNNSTVDLEDLAALSYKWLWQKPAYEIDAYDPILNQK